MDIIQEPSRIEYRDLIDEGVTMSEWINSPIALRIIFGDGVLLRWPDLTPVYTAKRLQYIAFSMCLEVATRLWNTLCPGYFAEIFGQNCLTVFLSIWTTYCKSSLFNLCHISVFLPSLHASHRLRCPSVDTFPASPTFPGVSSAISVLQYCFAIALLTFYIISRTLKSIVALESARAH